MSKTPTFSIKAPQLDLKKVSYTYDILVDHAPSGLSISMRDVSGKIIISNGVVWLDGKKVQNPTFDQNALSWSEQTEEGFCSGILHFTPDLMAFMGTIHKGKTSKDAVEYRISGTVPPTLYTTTITLSTGKVAGLNLKFGYKPAQSGFPTPVRELGNDKDGYQSIVSISSMKVNSKNNHLQLSMNYDSDLAQAGVEMFGEIWPATFSLEFSWDSKSFDAQMQQYDPANPTTPKKEELVWEGVETVQSQIKKEHALTFLAAVPEKQVTLQAVQKSVADLMTISPDGVRDLANNMLIEDMKYAMPSDWREDILGSALPVLSQERVTQLEPNKDFYSDKLAPAYLTWGLANTTSEAITVKLNDAQKRRLKYYLHNGLAKEKGYNGQSNALFIDAFVESSPKLQDYINDTTTDWGEALYNSLITDAQLNQIVNIVIANQSMQVPNRYATLIACFPDKQELAIDYNKRLLSAMMMQISKNYKADDKKQILTWLPDFIQQFINAYAAKPDNPDESQEMARWQMAEELKEASEQMGNVMKLADAMADFITAAGGASFYSKTANAQEAWLAAHPKFSKVASFIRVAALAGGLYTVVTGFMEWKHLDTQAKVELVITTVDLAGNIILAVPDIVKIGDMSLSGIVKVARWFNSTRVGQFISNGLDRVVQHLPDMPDWLTRLGARIGDFFDAAKRTIVDTAEFLSKFFRGFATFMRFFGVAVAGAFAVLSTITFVKDLIDGAPTLDTVFDGLIMGAGIAETICLVIDLVVVTEIFAVAAAIFAVLGLIFVIVEMFLPHPKPESPMDKFLNEHGVPFVNALPDPPKDWKEPETPKKVQVVHA